MKIKAYHVYLMSMVALGIICFPILGSASSWENQGDHTNEARWEPYPGRYGICSATLQVRELWNGDTYLGADEIVSYSGWQADIGWYIKEEIVGVAQAGRGTDGYLFCSQAGAFEYYYGSPNHCWGVEARTYWNDNSHHYINQDIFIVYY